MAKGKKKDKAKKKRKGEKKAVKAASNHVADSARVVTETAVTEPPSLDTPATIEAPPSSESFPAAVEAFDQPSGYSLLSGFWFRIGVIVIVIVAGIAIYSNSVGPPETEIAGVEFSQQTAPASTADSAAEVVSADAGQSENTAVDAITAIALPATTDRQDSEEQTPAGESETIETDSTTAMPTSELPQQVLTGQSQQYRPLEPEPHAEPEQPEPESEPAPAATGHAAPLRYPAGGYPYQPGGYAYPPARYYPGYQR